VQRLFSTFPAGLPGIALILLRLSVTISLLQRVHGYDLHRPSQALALAWFAALSLCLCLGLLTPIASILVMATVLAYAAGSDAGQVGNCIAVLNALALALLGPGAYSIDGYRFGRRLVVLAPGGPAVPPDPRAH
jgi:hypothetical protein